MKKLEIITLINKEDLYKKLPFYYVYANFNKILCVSYSVDSEEIKYNLRDPDLIELLNTIFTKQFFKDKYGKYTNTTFQLYCLVNWKDKELISLYSICGLINDDPVNVAEIGNFINIIKPAGYKIITTKESFDSIFDTVNDQDLFIRADIQDLEIYNYKK